MRNIFSFRPPFLEFKWPEKLCKLTRAQEPSLKTLRRSYRTQCRECLWSRDFSGLNHLSSLSDSLFLCKQHWSYPFSLCVSYVTQICGLGLPLI